MSDPLNPDTVPFNTEPSLVFDALDIDVVLKVLNQTAFSPFFCFFIPVIYLAQGEGFKAPFVLPSLIWLVLVTVLWLVQSSSVKWRNGWKSERVSWEDQIVLVTGGASGIGELLANTLAVRNVTVVALDIVKPAFDNDNITFYECDVSNWESVERVAKQIVEEVGHPTVIVNNAGVIQGKTIIDLDPADVKQTLGVNTLAHFWTLKAFLPEMIKQKTGHVVTVSSALGFAGAARVADYSASKFATVGLHESLRYELDSVYKTPRIRTTLLAPGYIQTKLFSRSQFASRTPPTGIPPALFRFLAPQLSPHDVVKKIIAAVDVHQSQEVLMPAYVGLSRVLCAGGTVPSWARDMMQWMAGADYIMEGFVKVSGRRPEEGAAPVLDTRAQSSTRKLD